MKEKNGVKAIERHLPMEIYRMSTTGGMMSNGSPDKYYDHKRDLWVEYKALSSLPRSGLHSVAPVMGAKQQPKGKLTVLQLTWLMRRHRAGGNAIVILILPNKTAVVLQTPEEWTTNQPVAFKAKSFKETGEWIQNFCGGFYNRA